MPKVRFKDDLDQLLPVAECQEGYFLAAQAAEEGIGTTALFRLARGGHVDRIFRGVYRLARWPAPQHPGLWVSYLWAKSKNVPVVFTLRTALSLHDVSDVNPSRIDVTLPVGTRVRSDVPSAVTLHYDNIPEKDVQVIDGLPVTCLYRTLMDLMTRNVARDSVEQVLFSDALPKEQVKELMAFYNLGPDVRAHLATRLPSMEKIDGQKNRSDVE